MTIDTHIHPALFKEICNDKQRFEFRCEEMNYHLMSPSDLELLKLQFGLADIKRVVLLPEDCSSEVGDVAISNDEIVEIVNLDPELFIGFASVDPRNKNAKQELEAAFTKKKLKGFTINTAKLKMYPNDERLIPLYKLCNEYQKPIIFHAGFSLEKNALSIFSQPILFEEIIQRFPNVNMCLAHFGWPWVKETAALLLKYPNAYANTAMMYMDSPAQLFNQIFKQELGEYSLSHNLVNKVMFGSDSPRIRPVRSKRGIESLDLDEDVQRKIFYENAVEFLGLER